MVQNRSETQAPVQEEKKKSDLGTRFAVGFVYVLISVFCVVFSSISTALYVSAVGAVCTFEFCRMMRADCKLVNDFLAIGAAVLYPLAVYFWGLRGAMAVAVLLLLSLACWYVASPKSRITELSLSYFAPAYTSLLLCSLILIRQSLGSPWGGALLVLLLAGVWFNDAVAYLVGSKIGKHKMAPTISPKKSWEGFIAGLAVSVLFWSLMSLVPGVSMPLPLAMLFGVVCGISGVLGDLVESRMKRNVGVKDAGDIMPGHGGMLDRSDSLITASVCALVLLYVGGCIPIVL